MLAACQSLRHAGSARASATLRFAAALAIASFCSLRSSGSAPGALPGSPTSSSMLTVCRCAPPGCWQLPRSGWHNRERSRAGVGLQAGNEAVAAQALAVLFGRLLGAGYHAGQPIDVRLLRSGGIMRQLGDNKAPGWTTRLNRQMHSCSEDSRGRPPCTPTYPVHEVTTVAFQQYRDDRKHVHLCRTMRQ